MSQDCRIDPRIFLERMGQIIFGTVTGVVEEANVDQIARLTAR